MSYTLWSRGRLVGHTELDIPCVQSSICQGFIEPTDAGRPLLAIAAGLPAACAALDRAKRLSGRRENSAEELETLRLACDQRDELRLELHDEDGKRFPARFIRVYDIRSSVEDDYSSDELCGPDGEPLDEEAKSELEAEIAELVADFESSLEGEEWKGEPESDLRWDTMQYHCMVFLGTSDDHGFVADGRS